MIVVFLFFWPIESITSLTALIIVTKFNTDLCPVWLSLSVVFTVSKQFLVVLWMVARHYAGNRALAISKSSDEVFCGYYNPLASVCNWQIRFIRKLMFAKTQVKQSILLTRFEQRKKKACHIFGIETPTGNFAP